MISTIQDWAKLLASASGTSPSGGRIPDLSERFTDESGHRREVDIPFLAWLRRDARTPGKVSADAQGPPDVALWSALVRGEPVPDPVWAFHRRAEWRSNFDQGSLFPQRDESGPIAIEVWTEVELCSLHALAWFADADPSLRPLVQRTARWLIDNLQPDNATNHPWAVHVFAAIGVCGDNPDGSMYAQTLLHNCQIAQGRPDAFSALILKDAADSLATSAIGSWLVDSGD